MEPVPRGPSRGAKTVAIRRKLVRSGPCRRDRVTSAATRRVGAPGRAATVPGMAAAAPCLLDCDPGHDDAIALLLAAAHPALDLRAVTTVAGNGPLDKVTLNARKVCTLAGLLDVPIAAGAAGPAEGDLEAAVDVHGESALDGPELPDPEVHL